MNYQSVENEISRLLSGDCFSNNINGEKLFHIHARPLQKMGWFLSLYIGSLLSIGGIVGGVRWILAFL